ncbi:unnamed protein product [Blepharisma stoltei]|uniref:Sel1 repeat family protein n=1 Tax=Blepharisma stoltei TaxID=1481888 RepID=A0AAU9IQ57_9CILI|nr:unnamed protein product [Blepharisma stoltei]
MQDYGSVNLSECIEMCVDNWFEENREESEKGHTEAMLIYSQLLFHGSGNREPDIRQAIYWLRKACKTSPEAAFRLGRLYQKGKYIEQDLEKAYFYYKLATVFRCKCGNQKEAYHTNQVSNVHPCYPYEATETINSLPLTSSAKKKCETNFNNWRSSSLK